MTTFVFRRAAAAAALVAVVAGGLVTTALLPGTTATDIAGDALYAVAVYVALVLVAPRMRRIIVATLAALWCVAVELLQLTAVPGALAAVFPPAPLVLGTAFDPRDLVVYLVAIAVAALVDIAVSAAARAASERPSTGRRTRRARGD